MAENYNEFISSWPKALDSKGNEMLFYKMAQLKAQFEDTKDPKIEKKIKSIREELISRNLT